MNILCIGGSRDGEYVQLDSHEGDHIRLEKRQEAVVYHRPSDMPLSMTITYETYVIRTIRTPDGTLFFALHENKSMKWGLERMIGGFRKSCQNDDGGMAHI